MKSDPTNELLELLGEADFLRLVESFAGCRVFVPSNIVHRNNSDNIQTRKAGTQSKLASEIGEEAATKLSARFGGSCIRVPLAREFRAVRYRKQGLSNAKIAVRIGMTETGVDAIFARRRAGRRAKIANDNRRKLINEAGDR